MCLPIHLHVSHCHSRVRAVLATCILVHQFVTNTSITQYHHHHLHIRHHHHHHITVLLVILLAFIYQIVVEDKIVCVNTCNQAGSQ